MKFAYRELTAKAEELFGFNQHQAKAWCNKEKKNNINC